MACRPKDALGPGADAEPSSKIFKSLANSEAGRSFQINEGSSPTSAHQKGSSSFTNGQDQSSRGSASGKSSFSKKKAQRDESRSGRANEALNLRETLISNPSRGRSSLPRGKTFERKKNPQSSDQYDDQDDGDESIAPNSGKGLAQIKAGGDHANKADMMAARESLSSRFKSTSNTVVSAVCSEGADDA